VNAIDATPPADDRRRAQHDSAADARTDFAELALVRYPHQPLSDRVWALRQNLIAYDALSWFDAVVGMPQDELTAALTS
jgi:hypothetical protein